MMRSQICILFKHAVLTLALTWGVVTAVVAQPPATITVQGVAQNSAGSPLTGARDYRVRFFDAASAGNQLGSDLTGSVTLSTAGRFSIELTPPTEILSAAGVWYELAVDSDVVPNGIGTNDVFPDRVKVTSVPFAQLASDSKSLDGTAAAAYSTDAELSAGLATKANTSHAHSATDVTAGTLDDARIPATVARDAEIMPTVLANDGTGSTLDADLLDGVQGTDYSTDAEVTSGLAGKADAANVLPRVGAAHVIVTATDNAMTNGSNLLAAYAQAKALSPHGLALSATNRAVVIVPPGRYDVGTGQLVMDTEFVDLVGLSSKREDQYVFGQTNGPNTGVLRQTANDVGIENLLVQSTPSSGTLQFNSSDPAAYFPDSGTTDTVIRNCEFRDDGANHSRSMRTHISYLGIYFDCTGGYRSFGRSGTASGTFTNCKGGDEAFGGGGTASGTFTDCTGGSFAFGGGFATASGTFTNCTGGDFSFGGIGTASGVFSDCTGGFASFAGGVGGGFSGTASGTFTNCTGGGSSFGGSTGGTASGTFTNCTGGFASFAGGLGGTASGEFRNCKGGSRAFGGGGGSASGTFIDCVGLSGSFGGQDGFDPSGNASGTFLRCSGGEGAFAGHSNGTGGVAGGSFSDCTATTDSFGGNGGTASGSFINCKGEGNSFGGNNGVASGEFTNCTGSSFSFGGGDTGVASGLFTQCVGGQQAFGGLGDTTGGRFFGCQMTGAYDGPFRGRMENCRWEDTFQVGSTGRIYGSTIVGTLNLTNVAAGVTQSRAQSIINDASNVFGATNAEALNIEDPDVQ